MRNMLGGLGLGIAFGVFVSLLAVAVSAGGSAWLYGLVVVGILLSVGLGLRRARMSDRSREPRARRQVESARASS